VKNPERTASLIRRYSGNRYIEIPFASLPVRYTCDPDFARLGHRALAALLILGEAQLGCALGGSSICGGSWVRPVELALLSGLGGVAVVGVTRGWGASATSVGSSGGDPLACETMRPTAMDMFDPAGAMRTLEYGSHVVMG
jgi:hypothetical protein